MTWRESMNQCVDEKSERGRRRGCRLCKVCQEEEGRRTKQGQDGVEASPGKDHQMMSSEMAEWRLEMEILFCQGRAESKAGCGVEI